MPRRKTVGRKSSRGHQGELILKTGPKKRHSKVATMPRTKTKARKSGTGIAPVSNGTQPQLVLKTRAKKKEIQLPTIGIIVTDVLLQSTIMDVVDMYASLFVLLQLFN